MSEKKIFDLAFIYVPSKKIYVSKNKLHSEKNWHECDGLLKEKKYRLPTFPEEREFLKYLRYSNNQEYLDLFYKITASMSWEAEWINFKIKLENKKFYINSEVLEKGTLMKDKGISLDDWFDNSYTIQGLPSKKIKEGKDFYWSPEKDKVTFGKVFSVRGKFHISAYAAPSTRDKNLGARAVISLEDFPTF